MFKAPAPGGLSELWAPLPVAALRGGPRWCLEGRLTVVGSMWRTLDLAKRSQPGRSLQPGGASGRNRTASDALILGVVLGHNQSRERRRGGHLHGRLCSLHHSAEITGYHLCVRSQAWSIGETQRGVRGEEIFVNFLPCSQQAKVRSVWSPWGISATKAHPATFWLCSLEHIPLTSLYLPVSWE